MPATPEIRRRFYLRFRLRSLLLLIVAVALPAAWVSERARRQRDAITNIHRQIGVSYERPSEQPAWASMQTLAAKLLGDDFVFRVVGVFLDADKGDDFTALDHLPYVESAEAGGANFKGPVLADVMRRMPNLRELAVFRFSGLIAADISCLQPSLNLKKLSLGLEDDQTCEEFMREIARLRQLRSLELWCPRLTSGMVRHLANAAMLEEITINPLKENAPAQVRSLQKALPHCTVYEYLVPQLIPQGSYGSQIGEK